MVVATLYTWQADPLFLAAEEVQDSADRLQSSFHQWQLLLQRRECGDESATWQTHPENDNDGDSIWPVRSGDDEDVVVVTVDQQVDEEGVRLVMLCACDTLRWQLEAFERAARDDEWRAEALGQAPSSVNETRERRRQFVSAIRMQLQQVQAVIRPAIGASSAAADTAVASGSSVGSSSAVSGVDSGGITVAFPSGLAAAASNASSRAAAAAVASTETDGGAAGGGAGGVAGKGGYGEKETMGSGRLLLDGRVDMAEMELGLLQLNNSQVAQMNAHWPAQRLAEEEEEDDQRQGSAHDDDAGENQRLVFGWQLSLHRKKRRSRSKAGGKGGVGESDGEESEGGAAVLMGLNGRELVTALVAIVGIVLLILLLLSWCGVGGSAQQASSSPSLPPPND
ncbi:unnamed protein product [Closterium sp. NIES-64]|nr:unnamed protein product [Closterium sp. NIES-64]